MVSRKPAFIIAFFCAIKLVLHLIADYHSGFQGDEFLHIACGNHPDVGYMEFPPVIGWLAFVQDQFHSQSVFVHHIFTHIASLLILLVVALTVMELGGCERAVFFALLCMMAAPCFGRTQQLFQPVVFSQLFWLLSFYQLVRFVRMPVPGRLLYLALCLATGFLSKYDMVFFIGGLASLLFFGRTRAAILDRNVWKPVLLFFALVSPNIWWQYRHQFPVFQMFLRLYEVQLDHLTALAVAKDLILTLNPMTAFFWIGGFVFMLNKRESTTFRPIGVSIILSILFLALGRSKAYYFYPAFITLLIFGSIWFEQMVLHRRAWLIYPASILLLISGAALMPYSIAILPLDPFIRYAHIKEEDGHYKVSFQEYYSPSKWQKTLTAIETIYDSLPPAERANCLIWGKHYSQAGAVDLYRETYHLPPAFSLHGSFYLWVPEGPMPATVIAFSNDEAGIDFFQPFFDSVTAVRSVYNPYADFDKDLRQTIYICRKPRQNFTELKAEFANRIFE